MIIFGEMLHDPIFIISFITTIVVLLLQIVSNRRIGRLKKVGRYLLLFLVISGPVLGFNLLVWSRSDVHVNESPTGEYRLITRWIDQGGFGYMNTEVIIAKPGFFGARQDIGYSTPLSVEWISDDEFRVSSGGYGADAQILNAHAFFK